MKNNVNNSIFINTGWKLMCIINVILTVFHIIIAGAGASHHTSHVVKKVYKPLKFSISPLDTIPENRKQYKP